MNKAWQRRAASALAACAVAGAGAGWLAHARLQTLQADFETDARIVHRLLSQRVVQYDAILATLALLQPREGAGADAALQRLPAVYPQITGALQRAPNDTWPTPLQTPLEAAETRSRASRHAELAAVRLPEGRYTLVLAAPQDTLGSYALQIDLRATVPWDEWPMRPETSPVRVTLEHAGQAFVVQAGHTATAGVAGATGWTYSVRKRLAAPSQPLDVVAQRHVGWAELPWWGMLGWMGLTAALWAAGHALWRQRIARRRAEELLRLGQVARLNTLGELAAGMAHELNQPLTAVLANTQAAGRLLAESPPDLDTARMAMDRAVEQARRASGTVGRLRQLVERPALNTPPAPLLLQEAVRDALHLLEPECRKAGVVPQWQPMSDADWVLADPVALQQILHNLLMNALQALSHQPPDDRRLLLRATLRDERHITLAIEDNGPGVPAEVRDHLFEPFTTTREGGLGLGLTLCDSLAQAMGAHLSLAPAPPAAAQHPGACFHLDLLRAPPPP